MRSKTSWVYEHVHLEPKLIDIKLHSKKSLKEKDEFFKRNNNRTGPLKSFEALHNIKAKLQQSYRDDTFKGDTYKGAKTLSSYKNYLRIVDKPSLKDNTVIVEFEDNGIDSLFTKIDESFKTIRRDIELLLQKADLDQDEIRADLYDRIKQIDDKTKEIRNLWLQAKI